MNILVLNCGSSSVKFQLIETDGERSAADADRRLARGVVERVGGQALIRFESDGARLDTAEPVRDPRAAVDRIAGWLASEASRVEGLESLARIDAVGHRVVHGGEHFRDSVRIDDAVIAGITECIELAPLHNPANLRGIEAVSELLGPGVPQVAVFDTAFHATMPETSFLYALPYQLYRRHKIRRYGFHGTSHRYIAHRYARLRERPAGAVNIITLHLGNGCSACGIREGRSHITSMGFTPLEGLVMGTRSGDVDPAVLEFLHHKEGYGFAELDSLLNTQSGLLGVSGLTSDVRELLEEAEESGDRRARLAIDLFCSRVKRYIGAYVAELGGVEAVVFSGGIGENAPAIRSQICDGLGVLGISLDAARNDAARGQEMEVGVPGADVSVFVIPTDEERMIARDTCAVLERDGA